MGHLTPAKQLVQAGEMRSRYGGRMIGTIFYDPFATPPPVPAAVTQAPPRRLTQQAADEKAFRAASLLNVSVDLERLSRQRQKP